MEIFLIFKVAVQEFLAERDGQPSAMNSPEHRQNEQNRLLQERNAANLNNTRSNQQKTNLKSNSIKNTFDF